MATFPKLSTDAITQYPSGRRLTFSTVITRFVDGGEQRFRELGSPVQHWLVNLSKIDAREAGEVELFFEANQGQFGSFSFVDPWDGTEYPDCSLDDSQLSLGVSSEGKYQTKLLIRNNAL